MVVHNEDNSQTAGFSTGSLETDINEDSTPHISIIYMGDVNKTYGILNNETNDVIVTPDVKVCVKSKQSENLSANSSRRIYVDHGTYKYNSNEVNIRTGSKIQKNSDKNVNSKDNNDVTEQIKRAQYSLENPPDGGWGWVVTISAFMVAVILDGISFSFGLFFKELYVYFNESKTLTSWISSVFNGSYLGIGKSNLLNVRSSSTHVTLSG